MSATAFEPILDITGVGAVLAVTVSIGREGLSAAGTGECVERLSIDVAGVAVPPFEAAGIRAELHFLSSGVLHEWLSAALAVSRPRSICIIRIGEPAGEIVSSAISRDLAFGKPQRMRYRCISVSFFAKAAYLFFLLCVHDNTSRHFPLEKGREFERK
jgi:hypothetical protein